MAGICEQIIARALTIKGSVFVMPDVLESCLDAIWAQRYFVQSMEAHHYDGDKIWTDMQFCILGLDGDENWERHRSVTRIFALVKAKLEDAKLTDKIIKVQIWLDDWPEDAPERGA